MEFDGFCAHDWGEAPDYVNHTRVTIIFKKLTKLGLTLWFDKVHMARNIRNQMSQGIENSKCVLVFITNPYQAKVNSFDPEDNCYFEFNFACFRLSSKRILPIVMEKGMLNSKTWKGRLAAELGSHLFVDLTDAIELYELNQKELLHEKCEEIKRQVDIIKGYGFDSLTGEEANEFEKLSLENQLTWIPQFVGNLEEEYHKNIIHFMNNICRLLSRFKESRYTVINKLLQAVDFDKILMKIMNLPENLKIMEAFSAILPRADHNLISTVFTSFIVLLGHSEVHEKFLSLLTESDIHEVIVFILNNKLKCDMEKEGQIQLRSKLYLLAIFLSESPTRHKYFAVQLFQQNNRLMILSAVKDISCSIQALKHVGYSIRELQEAGYNANIVKVAGYSARELKEAGYSIAELKGAG